MKSLVYSQGLSHEIAGCEGLHVAVLLSHEIASAHTKIHMARVARVA
nr:MAG TPA: hypothetical protein [Caudoviricetes sp.]